MESVKYLEMALEENEQYDEGLKSAIAAGALIGSMLFPSAAQAFSKDDLRKEHKQNVTSIKKEQPKTYKGKDFYKKYKEEKKKSESSSAWAKKLAEISKSMSLEDVESALRQMEKEKDSKKSGEYNDLLLVYKMKTGSDWKGK